MSPSPSQPNTAEENFSTLVLPQDMNKIVYYMKNTEFRWKIPTKNFVYHQIFINKGELNFFPETQSLIKFITTRPAVLEIFKRVLNLEMKERYLPPQNTVKYIAHTPYKAPIH